MVNYYKSNSQPALKNQLIGLNLISRDNNISYILSHQINFAFAQGLKPINFQENLKLIKSQKKLEAYR